MERVGLSRVRVLQLSLMAISNVHEWVLVISLIGASLIMPILTFLIKFGAFVSDVRIIGVVSNCEEPEEMARLKHFTSLFKARLARGTVVLRCRNLSFALRFCDFVCAEVGCDEKVIPPNSTLWKGIIENY